MTLISVKSHYLGSDKENPLKSRPVERKFVLLPPAYVVRREGNSFTLLVCPHLGRGYPYPIMLCNISQNAMGQTPGGTLPDPAGGGGTLPGPAGGVPRSGTPRPGQDGGYPAGGVRRSGTSPPPTRCGRGGGTQLGQQKEYLLHGWRYASCVHAGGLSCL